MGLTWLRFYSFPEDPIQNEGAVAFTVYASGSRFYEIGEVVTFDSVLTNEGEHYQTNSSFFICPKDGLYVFSVTVCGNTQSEEFQANIMRENEAYVTARAHVTDIDQGLATAAMFCGSGERFCVRVQGTGTIGELYASETDRVSTFTGYLIEY